MDVLALIHGDTVRSGSFADVVRRRGDRLVEHNLAWGRPLPRAFDALIVLGGGMHPDHDEQHPWLLEELELLREVDVPVLGVCLGAQLIARAAGAAVYPASEPEIGWYEVERTADDPVLGALPERFTALQWHEYTYDLPPGAVELARSPVCNQAFRLADAWGVQFHPEITAWHLERWAEEDGIAVPDTAPVGEWSGLGRRLCDAFLDYAAGRSSRRDHSCQEPA
jgi:GMP synthase-like glutamine amidotransferase